MHATLVARGARRPAEVAVTAQPFKRSQFGLFEGKTKQYGNNVPFSLHKTRRTWLPNVQRKRLFSDTLQSHVRVKLTTSALKTIKKKGGVDNYVTQTSASRLGYTGMKIRVMVREAQSKKVEEAGEEVVMKKARPRKRKEFSATLESLRRPQIASKFVRHTRRMAAKAIGIEGFATAKDTINYMKQQKIQQDRLLPSRPSIKLVL
ncbi:50S ribosomal protein L24 [Mycena rebaudengoi]|nr:50S ribosomal protein L24 [Mycena rebaudengoi]